eukprot:799591-Pyramimonas_sp.AAC.1
MQLYNIADRKLALYHGESYNNSKTNGSHPKNGDTGNQSKQNKGKNKVADMGYTNKQNKFSKKQKSEQQQNQQKSNGTAGQGSSGNTQGNNKKKFIVPQCTRCGRRHKNECTATHHKDGTVLTAAN